MNLQNNSTNLAFRSIYNEELALSFDYVTGTNVAHKFPLHIHDSLCIGLITKGKRTLILSNKTETINPNELFIINRNQPHTIIQTEPHDYIVITIKGLSDSMTFCNIIKSNTGIDFFLRLFNTLKNGEMVSLPEKWNSLYAYLMFAHKQSEMSDADKSLFNRSLAYIQRNYQNPIQIKDIASHVCMSTFHFCRLFKQTTGLSPHNYLKQYRLSQSYKRLKHKTPVFDTAIETGFYDSSHFIKTFYAYMAVSPRKYQDSVTQKPENSN
jgi:AraC-type DNA-binding domain-containing proteins